MINLAKSHIATLFTKILGREWETGGYFSAEGKNLRALLTLDHEQVANTNRARLYGILSFYRDYVPDFAAITDPLRAMVADDSLIWDEETTQRL